MWPPLTPPQTTQIPLRDGYRAHARVWRADGAADATPIFYFHGIQSHGGWFEWSASVLASCGRCVILPDRRGSGLNEAGRGDVSAARVWLDDAQDALAATGFGQSAVDLVAVSWGARPALAWALREPERVRRVLLIAPGIFPRVDVGFATRARIGWSLLTSPRRMFDIPLADPALFTDSRAGQEFIAADALALRRATARFLYFSDRLGARLRRLCQRVLRWPIAVMQARHDRIIDNPATTAWLSRVAVRPEVAWFPNHAHTIEFSDDREFYESELRAWARGR